MISDTPDIVGVLFIHTATQPPLGADTWVHSQIIRGIDKDRFDVHVACHRGSRERPTPTFAALRDVAGVYFVDVNFGRENLGRRTILRRIWGALSALSAVVSVPRLVFYVRRHRISILHTSDRPRDAFATIVLSRLTGATSIVHAHVGYNPEWMGRMLRLAIHRADALIAISDFVGSTLVSAGIERRRVHVVLNATDLTRFTPGLGRQGARREFGYGDEDVVVISVCRLFAGKGPGRLMRAFAQIAGDHAASHLLIVGEEMEHGYAAELAALAGELGIATRVTLAGRRGDVPALMAAADVYAMPSIWEPFGLVYLEAMAMELPVVALDNGGTPEVVEDGVTGLLSDPDDADALADNLSRLMMDPQLRSRMGRLGRVRVETSFTIERMAGDVEAVYGRLVSDGAGSARDGKLPR